MFEKQINLLKQLKYELCAIIGLILLSNILQLLPFDFIRSNGGLQAAISIVFPLAMLGIYGWIGYKSRRQLKLPILDAGMGGALCAFIICLFLCLLVVIGLFIGVDPEATQKVYGVLASGGAGAAIGFALLAIVIIISSFFAAMIGSVISMSGYFIAEKTEEKVKAKKGKNKQK